MAKRAKKKYYREITVNGKVYEYKISKYNIKIKGVVNDLPKHMFGYVLNADEDRIIVTPKMIAEYIKNKG